MKKHGFISTLKALSGVLRRVVMPVLLAGLLAGCVADRPFQNGPEGSVSASVEDAGRAGQAGAPAYVLAHVEFDDQGWFHDVRQRQALFAKLRALKDDGKAMLVVTYTHGWKHNASEGDDNLANFRKLLTSLAGIERAAHRANGPRTLVGVYIGWRGSSLPVAYLDNLTFWTRKNAAERVGARSVKQLFIELNQFRAYANGWNSPDELAESHETQLVFVGHSFGGLITYHALYSDILARGLQVNQEGTYRMAKSFGDFVLLVNPAFEGASYEPIWRAATLRGCYSAWQKPVMAIVTSSADAATRVAFPAGRLYTVFQSAPQQGEREAVMQTVGHLERYRTHVLEKRPAGAAAPPSSSGNPPGGAEPASRPNARDTTPVGRYQLVRTSNAAPAHMPYLVIQAGPDLISDHSDFWNDAFRTFTVYFIASQILAPVAARSKDQPSPREACEAFAAPVAPAALSAD